MKVLHVSTWKRRCGVADFAASIVEQLSALGIENEIFPLDVSSLRTMTSGEFLREMDRCADMAASYDVVHVQHEFSIFTGSGGVFDTISQFAYLLQGLKRASRPVVITFHSGAALHTLLPARDNGLANRRPPVGAAGLLQREIRGLRLDRAAKRLDSLWRKRVAPCFNRSAGRFRSIVHAARTRSEMINSGFAPESVSVVPLGIEARQPSFFQIDRTAARAQLGLAADEILLTIFGFVAAYKGHLPAVQALKKLPRRYRLAIVGGPHAGNTVDQTVSRVLQAWAGEDPKRLKITGYVPHDTIDIYHAATDICLAPFLMGNPTGSASLSWALTSGKPTIASNIPAFAEIEREGDCLLLCTPNAPSELAWHIQRLAGDPQLQHRLARNALAFSERYSWARVTGTLLNLYREMQGFAPSSSAAPTAAVLSQTAAKHVQTPLFSFSQFLRRTT